MEEGKSPNQSVEEGSERKGSWNWVMQTPVFNIQISWALADGLGQTWYLVINTKSRYVPCLELGSSPESYRECRHLIRDRSYKDRRALGTLFNVKDLYMITIFAFHRKDFFFRKKNTPLHEAVRLGGKNQKREFSKAETWITRVTQEKRNELLNWNRRLESQPWSHPLSDARALESQKLSTPFSKEFNTTAEFFFQTEVKLLDSYIRQTLYLPRCNTLKRMTSLYFSALEIYKVGAEKEVTFVLFLRADMTDR